MKDSTDKAVAPVFRGPLAQVAWVVADLDAAERWLSAVHGVRHWTRLPGIEFGPDTCTYRGEPANFAIDLSLAYAGDLQLELIAPIRGESIYSEHLAGPAPPFGVHHIAYVVDHLDGTLRRAAKRGLEVIQAGTFPGVGMSFAYVDATASGIGVIELIELSPSMRSFFEELRRLEPDPP